MASSLAINNQCPYFLRWVRALILLAQKLHTNESLLEPASKTRGPGTQVRSCPIERPTRIISIRTRAIITSKVHSHRMESQLQLLSGILVNPPGNLIYHLTLAFTVFACLQVALINRRGGHSGRILLGLNLILIAQLALFLISGLAWQGVISAHLFLPIFDRAVIVISLVLTGWMWAFPNRNRIADITTGVLALGILILFFFTVTQWEREGASLAFNSTWQDWAWSFSGVGVVVLALVAVLLRRPEGWTLGVGMAIINLSGLLAHIFLMPPNGDFAGFLRIAQLAAYPLLPGLLIRLSEPAPRPTTSTGISVQAEDKTPPAIADPRWIHAWADLNLQTEPAQIGSGIAHAVAQSLRADLCYVVSVPFDGLGPLIFQGGYDLIREEELAGVIFDQSRLPTLTNSLLKSRPLCILTTDSRPLDIKTLADQLRLKDVGNLLALPLTHAGKAWGGLVLLSPYSNRAWTVEDQNFLSSEVETITAILVKAQERVNDRLETERIKNKAETVQREMEELRRKYQEVNDSLAALSRAPERPAPAHPDLEALLAVQKETQDALVHLQNENARLKSQLAKPVSQAPHADETQLENELRTVLKEVARLQNQLVQSNIRILELEQDEKTGPPEEFEDREVISSLVHELRQPMSSIMGYTDLLLAESIGILGKAQKKFLAIIRSSADRMNGLVDELIQMTTIGGAHLSNVLPSVDLNEIIDQAVTEQSPKLRERSIQLNLDLPEELPRINSDRDSLLQITNHLLRNAGTASPIEGMVTLRARLHREEGSEFVIFQVTDSGGGVAAGDLPRLFNYRSKNDASTIRGIGESALSLGLTKTLVDAIGARIWVDTDPGHSTTFSILFLTRSNDNGTPEQP